MQDHRERVVVVNASREGPEAPLGGIQKAIIGQIAALRSHDIKVDVISAAQRCAAAAEALGCDVYYDPRWHNSFKPLVLPALIRPLLHIRKQHPAAVIHHSGRTWTWGQLFFAGVPNIAVLHRERPHTYRFFHRWLALSPGFYAQLRKQQHRRRVAWAQNCLMNEPTIAPRSIAREQNHFTLGFLGRASDGKGLESLLQAIQRLRSEGLNIHLSIAGTLDPWVMGMATELGLQDAVKSLGWLEHPQDLFAVIDCLVLPSEKESFGLVLIEAMAAGLPTIATRCNGPQSIIVDQQTGILVPIGDTDALGQAIKTLANDPALTARMGQRGFERVINHYTPRTAAIPLIQALRQLGADLSDPAQV